MTLLVISPDYASHVLPLATLATQWRDQGERVVVATGPATDAVVAGFGMERCDLRLGRGSNPGVIRADQQPAGEDDNLRAFFAATRRGMIETLRYQAEARRNDLLWEPVAAAQRVLDIVEDVRPDQILVDHLAFGATLGLRAAGIAYGDVILGHPTALPVADEVYGALTDYPLAFDPQAGELDALRQLCEEVARSFTEEWNQALGQLNPDASPVRDAFGAHGDLVLLNYPSALHDPARSASLPPHAFLGSCVREDPPDAEVARWLAADDDRPLVYLSFGSFLSERADVLSTVLRSLEPLDLRVAVATGVAGRSEFQSLPSHWLARPFLPQVAILRQATVAVTHGGNNSVTECLAHGVPMVVLPFSTDQFAGAAAVERAGVGQVLDPNRCSVEQVANSVTAVLAGTHRSAAEVIGTQLQSAPGPAVAFDAMGDVAARTPVGPH